MNERHVFLEQVDLRSLEEVIFVQAKGSASLEPKKSR